MPASLIGALAVQSLLNFLAVVGFAEQFRATGEDLDGWLALGATLMLFASLHFIFMPLPHPGDVSLGDYLRLLAYGVLLVGVWRAIRASEFGRAVAEERARVAREIHDGLAQYLFAVSTHASMLETAPTRRRRCRSLKAAALAAQQEARYAVLALSSAAGRSPFDAALRRYVDFLTADGALDVELEIDPAIGSAPTSRSSCSASCRRASRTHASMRAPGTRGWRSASGPTGASSPCATTARGSSTGEEGGGQGLRNMRERAASIGGALTLRSAPGAGHRARSATPHLGSSQRRITARDRS